MKVTLSIYVTIKCKRVHLEAEYFHSYIPVSGNSINQGIENIVCFQLCVWSTLYNGRQTRSDMIQRKVSIVN